MLAIFDDALIRFFGQYKWNQNTPPILLARSGRENNAIDLFIEKTYNKKKSDLVGPRTFPKPLITVVRDALVPDGPRENPGTVRNVHKDAERGLAVVMKAPKAEKFDFDVNIYLDNETQLRHFELQTINLFPYNTGWVPVDFGDKQWYLNENKVFQYGSVLGEQLLQIDLNQKVDNTNYENSGKELREIQYTLGCTLHVVIPFQPYSVPLATQMCVSVVDDEGTEFDNIEIELGE